MIYASRRAIVKKNGVATMFAAVAWKQRLSPGHAMSSASRTTTPSETPRGYLNFGASRQSPRGKTVEKNDVGYASRAVVAQTHREICSASPVAYSKNPMSCSYDAIA